MTTEKRITLQEAQALLEPMVGALAWFVRDGADRILRIEFGEPHLCVSNIRRSGLTEPSGFRAVSRRVAVPTGQWSLFIEDGAWTVQVDTAQATRFGLETSKDDRCFSLLSGQKLSSLIIGDKSPLLTLEFDLGGHLIIEANVDFDLNSQWMIFFKSGEIVASNSDGSLVLEE